jgi:hypothetical protein
MKSLVRSSRLQLLALLFTALPWCIAAQAPQAPTQAQAAEQPNSPTVPSDEPPAGLVSA